MLSTNGPAERQPLSARFLLRDSTADLHKRIDDAFSGPFDTDTASYGRFLLRLAAAICSLEQGMESEGIRVFLPDWDDRRRRHALARDLETLGVAMPEPAQSPFIAGEAALFGAAYVLEGSRLGGKVLLRRVMANPDPRARAATHHLRHGNDAGLWQSFLTRLEASTAVRQAPDEAVAGARAAFGLFEAVATHA